jgi:hypothetical protein
MASTRLSASLYHSTSIQEQEQWRLVGGVYMHCLHTHITCALRAYMCVAVAARDWSSLTPHERVRVGVVGSLELEA